MTISESLARMLAVARADLIGRVRRPASLVLLLGLCVFAYSVVPPLESGRTLMQRDGHRALLDSASISLATGMFASILLGMLGFYLISSAIRRDTVSRVGQVIAAMPVRNVEYLGGKYLANIAFLGLVVAGYLANVMVMHLLRAERPLEPLVYVATYAGLVGPAILVLSAIALVFECVRWLSGRVGDVLYFFVWVLMVAVAAGADRAGGGVSWLDAVDVLGFRFMIAQVNAGGTPQNISVGGMPFDPQLAPWIFTGFRWTGAAIASRLMSSSLALPLFGIAWLAFARFDPAKVKAGAQHARRNPVAALNRTLKPVTRLLLPLVGAGRGLARITICETWLTFTLSPLVLLWAAALGIGAIFAAPAALRGNIIPFAFLGIVASVADVSTRDAGPGVRALLYSMPSVRRARVPAQWLTALSVALVFLAVPFVRTLFVDPAAALSLAIGAAFVAALAVSLGTLTGGSKAFVGLFLLYFYLVMSVKGAPEFDFAGFNGAATAGVRAGYAAAAAVLLAAAALRVRLAPAAA